MSTPVSLSVAELKHVLREEVADCTQLGIHLNIQYATLKELERQSMARKPVMDCFTEMCDHWLINTPKKNKTWSVVYKAIGQQGNNRLVKELKAKGYREDREVDLTLKGFMKELNEMAAEWELLGGALGIPREVLMMIRDSKGLRRYMDAMLEIWLDTGKATWEQLQKALIEVGNLRLSDKIEVDRKKDLEEQRKVSTAMTALNHWVTMRLSKFRTMGAPGSGKTSVLDLTMGKPPPEVRESTDCIKSREITIAPILAHEEEWETVTTTRMNEMVRKAIKAKIDEQKKTRDVPPTTTSSSPHPTSSSPYPTRPREELAQETTQKPLKVIKDMLDKLGEIEGSMELMDFHWVFTQDTGGQPCYQSVAPLLLRENSCSVITTKLNEKLESKPEFAFFIKGNKVPMSSAKIQLTNLQMIETLVKSQASVNPSLLPSQAPKYIIVGTFEDEAFKCEETIGTKNAILKERLSGLKDQRIDNGGSIIFPINAVTQKEKERKEKTEWLRRKILESPGATVKKKVNICWFGLLLHLITEDKDTYTLDECLEAGKSLRMDEDKIFQAIEFFHGLGIMIHFRTPDLEGVIIVKVKVVFSTLSLLLGISFIDRDTLDHEFKLNLSANTQERLQKYGRFNKELLLQKQFLFSDVFTAEYFLDLLEHVTAVIAVGEDEYFLPSALAFATDEEIKQRVEGEPVEPWIIRLTRKKCGEKIEIPPPPAYLSSVFINVMKCFPECTLPSDEDDQFYQQYSNAMSLSYSDGFIHFIQRVYQIEVYFSECEDQPQKCHAIRSAVLDAAKITEEKLNIPPGILVKNDAFLCPCEESSNGRHEYVFKTVKKKAWCKNSKKYHELTPSQQRWLDEPQDTMMKVSSNPRAQVDGDGSSSEKYGCKVFYQRRGVNTWKITFAVFLCDKSDEVKYNEDEQQGPSCHFDLETDKLGIAPKERIQHGWSSKVTRKEVTKASVDAYTGAGKPPSCEMTVEAASSQSPPPPLAIDVELEGPRSPKIMILKRQAENHSIQALEGHELEAVRDAKITPINPRTFWKLDKCKYKGDGTTLMVFDTGIDKCHPSFSSRSKEMLLLPQEAGSYGEMGNIDDRDESGHGTLCAGIACGAEQDATLKHGGKSFKVCGVAPNAKLGIWKARNPPRKQSDPDFKSQESEFIRELKSLTKYVQENTFEKLPIDVLVIPGGQLDLDLDMKKCIETLDDKGIIIVCSGSNYGGVSNSIAYPARFSETICIGSNTRYYNKSNFSPEGSEMLFLGIGEDIIGPRSKKCGPQGICEKCGRKSFCLSKESSETFLIKCGTSFSAPAVGGLICLILETLKFNQEELRITEPINREFIVKLLKRLTNKSGGEPWTKETGHGAIDENRLNLFFEDPNHIIKELKHDKVIV